ncbi:acyl-CoA dehydrogenase family protein [Nocardia bovistercoris]|uniref:Acyl-CoA dehydrogenase family protein n=1 Tax=Nocardia bovistercoris TaxID=2785916 RepID=A0A931IGT5_9NOCA|nr:acyl-CoA dehydrogenase family protein [Nocardia bovistercoris]MBH0779762.1 acyl-CoA dehydrogenase family protein [Nocardia bovistercoris]
MGTDGHGAHAHESNLRDFVERFRGWIADNRTELDPLLPARADYDARVATARQLRRLLFDAEWGRWGWPEELGGAGGTIAHRAAVHDELFRVGWGGPVVFEHLEIVAPTLVRYADPEFARTVLPRFLDGSQSWAQGFSEPEAGSDLAALRTRAEFDGTDWVVDGAKIWTSWAKYARWCLALVRTGTAQQRHRGLTMIAIDLESPGVTMRPIRQANGTDELAEVTFDAVRVPANRIIGEVGGGWRAAMYLLARERGTLSWVRHCGFRENLRSASKSMSENTDRQVGEAALHLLGVRSAAINLMAREAEGRELGPDAALNKLLTTRTEQTLYNALRDIDSSRVALPDGSDDAGVLQQEYLFSRIVTIYGGSQQMQLMTIARHILGLGNAG